MDKLADTHAIAHMTHVTPATIRKWAQRGHLTRKGTGPRNRALYSITQAEQHAMKRRTQQAP